jgi:hypothetical protein
MRVIRKGLGLDPHYTNMHVGLARTLWKKGRAAEALLDRIKERA